MQRGAMNTEPLSSEAIDAVLSEVFHMFGNAATAEMPRGLTNDEKAIVRAAIKCCAAGVIAVMREVALSDDGGVVN